MNRQILTIMGVLLLSACGSGSDTATTLDVDFDSYKGRSDSSNLSTYIIQGGDEVIINSRLTGTISESDESLFVSFTPEMNQLVMVKLSSAAEDMDLDLFVFGETFYDESSVGGPSEIIFFEAIAGETYDIEVYSFEGFGEFTLDLLEPSRSALNLSANEYQYLVDEQISVDCDDYSFNSLGTSNYVINYQDGYLKYRRQDVLFNFDSVRNYTITVMESFSGLDGDISYSQDLNFVFTVDSNTGDISGTEVIELTEVFGSASSSCTYERQFEGGIIL